MGLLRRELRDMDPLTSMMMTTSFGPEEAATYQGLSLASYFPQLVDEIAGC